MKYGYSYKTPDGTRHESVYHASSKDEVFSALRKNGIRPIKVWEIEPRFPFIRKILIAVVFIAVTAVVAAILVNNVPSLKKQSSSTNQTEDRSQIYGDPGIIQQCESRQWANVFEDEGERFLARFAQPGLPVRMNGKAWRTNVAQALRNKPGLIFIPDSDSAEISKMKRMVNGMKLELSQYVKDGGTVEQYIDEVLERQSIEEKIVVNFKTEFEKLEKEATRDNYDETVKKWNAKNVLLRQMGLRTVLIPESIEY